MKSKREQEWFLTGFKTDGGKYEDPSRGVRQKPLIARFSVDCLPFTRNLTSQSPGAAHHLTSSSLTRYPVGFSSVGVRSFPPLYKYTYTLLFQSLSSRNQFTTKLQNLRIFLNSWPKIIQRTLRPRYDTIRKFLTRVESVGYVDGTAS